MKRSVIIVWIVPILVIGVLISAASTLEPDRQLVVQENGEEAGSQENEGIESISEFSGEDGTYEGTAEGYHDDVTLSVTVEGGDVVAIEVISQNERPDLWENVWSTLPETIISEQSTDVDTVSGATWSRRAVFNAVLAALSSE